MPAGARRNILVLVALILLVGCGDSRAPSASTAVTATTTRPVTSSSAPTGADAHKYDAYGPRQYSVFNGVNRDNIYRAATGPTTGPADDSVLIPADDRDW